jgi:hypothetical protein
MAQEPELLLKGYINHHTKQSLNFYLGSFVTLGVVSIPTLQGHARMTPKKGTFDLGSRFPPNPPRSRLTLIKVF